METIQRQCSRTDVLRPEDEAGLVALSGGA
jgi:hypothetical protein